MPSAMPRFWPRRSGKSSSKEKDSTKEQPTKPDASAVSSGKKGRSKQVATKKWLASIAPVPPSEVAAHLKVFGYAADDENLWDDLPTDEVPEGVARSGAWLGLGIAEHYESGGHTWYSIECSLAIEGLKTREWQVERRLGHFRKLWHDRVKAELGDAYKENFDDVHFAHRGGRRGTSARLDEWVCKLARCMNAGQLSPTIVSLTLRFLEAPAPNAGQADADCQGNATEECTSGVSTQCSFFGGAESGSRDVSDLSNCEEEEDEEEEYESDFESDSESGEDD